MDLDTSLIRSYIYEQFLGDYVLFEIDDYELMIKKGNKKPLPKFIWIISMESATECSSRKNGHCEIGKNCYALKYESNKLMYKTVERRNKDNECINYLIKNDMSDSLVDYLIKRNNSSKTHKLKYLRWNESGDVETLDHLLFIEKIALKLYDELDVISVVYTHREDIWNEFKKIRKSEHCLIVNGSGFMADNNFKAVKEFTGKNKECSSNCVKCFNEKKKYCYDLDNKGLVIEEILRLNK